MTLTPDRLHHTTKALNLIDQYRHKIGDNFRVEPLEVEFPYIHRELSRWLDPSDVYLVRADDNEAGTFKVRGALVGAAALQEQGATKFRLASAGNHARGSVVAARELGFAGVHVGVPENAPAQKQAGLYDLWSAPHLNIYPIGQNYDTTMEWMLNHPELGPLLHPYDDPNVIAGQGTLADDILRERPNVDVLVMPVGGGGLLAGIRQRLDELHKYNVITYGIEAPGSNSASLSKEVGEVREAALPNLKYGGSAVRKIGTRAFSIFQAAGDRVRFLSTEENEIEKTMALYQQSRVDLWRLATTSYEPTSLVAIAALEKVIKNHPDKTIAVIGTGHNAPLPQYI
jgi:threonine dehydratase